MTNKATFMDYTAALRQCATVEDVKALVCEYDADIGERIKKVEHLQEEVSRLTEQANQIEKGLPRGVWLDNFHASAARRAGEIALGREEAPSPAGETGQ